MPCPTKVKVNQLQGGIDIFLLFICFVLCKISKYKIWQTKCGSDNPIQQVRLDSLEDLLDVMAVGNPVMQRMLSERRAALGMPPRDPQESDPTRQQPSNPTNYFDNM
ncbi:hypothetical protein YC2023_114756 [Brassica napus]